MRSWLRFQRSQALSAKSLVSSLGFVAEPAGGEVGVLLLPAQFAPHTCLFSQVMDFADYFVGPVGLREKVPMICNLRRRWPAVSRSYQQKDLRPVFVNSARQFHTIDRPRHLNIREQDAHVRPARQDFERGICISSVDHFKPRFFEKAVHVEAQKLFVLNDEDRALAGRRASCHLVQRAAASSVSLAR